MAAPQGVCAVLCTDDAGVVRVHEEDKSSKIQRPDEGLCQVASQAAGAAQHMVSIEGAEVRDNKYDCSLKTDLHERGRAGWRLLNFCTKLCCCWMSSESCIVIL